ncbi:MAG: hypothetical protein A3A33_01415 [Candidatus Yanofskybacteria bacterium RIFCSPLOWO2_01_FULL_49_25]|uniref:YgjP-like metallopeptidase domain-containing protein n=1 Tax=Candidatus Yanofskybacteria bacterium RIFCSPLOWO2_01_FULL_49_25 TaxID=1802701 RepID=A0A1F8GX37_9BACT|nr:MAG: hypothetical protein A3A33_01415 [Candidatus Yanofskybacteria bacterium RIFCSPLOWO2_01_FULL_49_25]
MDRAHDPILRMIEAKIDFFNKHYQCNFNDIKVKTMKSRWGSCSRKKNLCFNSRIADLPDHLIDYIVVHELCHLREMNHSRKFWNLVAETIPHHRKFRTELRKVGMAMRKQV